MRTLSPWRICANTQFAQQSMNKILGHFSILKFNIYEWQEFFVLPFTIHLLGCPTINTRISGVKGWVEPFTTLHLIGIVTKTSYTPRPPPAISTSFSSILANIFPGGLTPNTLSLHLTIPIEGKVKNNLFFHCPLTIKVLPQ